MGIVAKYEKKVRVQSSGGTLDFNTIMDAIYRNVATGPNGLCPTCKSDTPVSQQNNGRGTITAKGVMPRNVLAPGIFKGEVSLRRLGSNLAVIKMASITHGLDGGVQIFRVTDTEYHVVEAGECRGPFAGTFCDAHNKYFDLTAAVGRNLR